MTRTLAEGKIGIGLLSKLCPDTFTTRSFEIPGAGAMLLAERTRDHLEIFEENHEAVFFSSKEEMLAKLSHYVKNESARRRIAEAGRTRVLKSFLWRDVLASVIRHIEQLRHAS
ncbi:MAG TPA: glycosyltransferase [Planctomycetota bacterium]|nr:glycosyltransferase [Planctomycetota bacterium]